MKMFQSKWHNFKIASKYVHSVIGRNANIYYNAAVIHIGFDWVFKQDSGVPITACCWTKACTSATSLCSCEIAVCICDTDVTSCDTDVTSCDIAVFISVTPVDTSLSTCSLRPQLLTSFSCWMTSYVDCDDVTWMTVRTPRHNCSIASFFQFFYSKIPHCDKTSFISAVE